MSGGTQSLSDCPIVDNGRYAVRVFIHNHCCGEYRFQTKQEADERKKEGDEKWGVLGFSYVVKDTEEV